MFSSCESTDGRPRLNAGCRRLMTLIQFAHSGKISSCMARAASFQSTPTSSLSSSGDGKRLVRLRRCRDRRRRRSSVAEPPETRTDAHVRALLGGKEHKGRLARNSRTDGRILRTPHRRQRLPSVHHKRRTLLSSRV